MRRAPRRVSNGGFLNTSWAGAVIPTGTWTGVVGFWTVPTISQPRESAVYDEGFEGWEMSTWVGIDGYSPNNSNDLLQIGVTQQLLTNQEWGCFAWIEWWLQSPPPGSPVYTTQSVPIMGFTVNPGDTVWCSVQYVGSPSQPPVGGTVGIFNETTGQFTGPLFIPAPSTADNNGSSVEWIVEAPDGGEGISSLPAFTPVTFNFPVACGVNGIFGPWSSAVTGTLLDIETSENGGTPLTSSSFGDGTVVISFVG
jgi:hypothetical protein